MTYDELFDYIAPKLCNTGLFRVRNDVDWYDNAYIGFIDSLCKLRLGFNAYFLTNIVLRRKPDGSVLFAEYVPFYKDGHMIKYRYLEFNATDISEMTYAHVDAIINHNIQLAKELAKLEEAETAKRLLAMVEQL